MAEQLFGKGVVLVGIGHRVVQFEQGLRLTHSFRQFLGRALSRVNDKFLHNVLVFFVLYYSYNPCQFDEAKIQPFTLRQFHKKYYYFHEKQKSFSFCFEFMVWIILCIFAAEYKWRFRVI